MHNEVLHNEVLHYDNITQSIINPFMSTVPTFAVRETDVSRHNGGTAGAPLKPLRDDGALRALSCSEHQYLYSEFMVLNFEYLYTVS